MLTDSNGSQRAREKWTLSRSIVKIEPKQLPDGLGMKCKGNKGIKGAS